MGLDIYGKKTNHNLSGSYSTLHHTTRYLSLIYCGMPEESIGNDIGWNEEDMKEIYPFSFYMHPFTINAKFNPKKTRNFLWAIQLSGYIFPNINMHSDAEGSYTKNGKILGTHLLTGNSKQLLKELEILCNDNDIIEKSQNNDRIKRALDYTIKFRGLVKDEIENGCGTIIFS